MDNFLRQNETMDHFYHRCNNVSVFNCSENEMLWWLMGSKRLPLKEIIPMSVFLIVIFLTGVIGNVSVCVVIVRHHAMHTATNYYLFSLALSDLLLLLFGLPNDLSVYWHQYPYSLGVVFCKLRALISEAATYGSVLTITAFSLERYLAICHPLHLYAMAGLRRAFRIIILLWMVSILCASPFAVYSDISYIEYPPKNSTYSWITTVATTNLKNLGLLPTDLMHVSAYIITDHSGNISTQSAFCALLAPSPLLELSSIFFFFVPAFFILWLYVRMGLHIRSTRVNEKTKIGTLKGVIGHVHGEARQAKSRKAVIRMLAAVVVAFFVCWVPFHVQRLFYVYGYSLPQFQVINEHLFNIAGALYYVSATVNPILYNVMSGRYRLAFRETLLCPQHPRPHRDVTLNSSTNASTRSFKNYQKSNKIPFAKIDYVKEPTPYTVETNFNGNESKDGDSAMIFICDSCVSKKLVLNGRNGT